MERFVTKQGNMRTWHTIFKVLSIKRVEPFLFHMGLKFTPTQIEAIRQGAQYFVEQYEQSTGDEKEDAYLFQKTFEQIAQTAGEEIAATLFTWGIEYIPRELSQGAIEFIWEVLLRRLARLSGANYELAPLTLTEDKLKDVTQTIKMYLGDYNQITQQIEEAEAQPKSTWDERIYRTYEEPCTPMDWVLNMVSFQKTRQAWQKIKTTLTDEEMEVFFEWGKVQAEMMKIPVELVRLPS